ncbi:hypothetical protein ACH5RR_002740 [Cinchona calisaya]|uniref:GDSL esterase/lipase n=1 Tax=Cinchona calisaya TaxID=153742 RepID=A0ABD3ASZ4_9GENT
MGSGRDEGGHAVVVAARYHKHPNKTESFQAKKLFVFGDSYADTGNSDSNASSWKQPYGITFPGHPSGRYSDGRLLTDYVAMYYGLGTPIASRFITGADDEQVRYGVNFAYGGTGVFDTGVGNPDITDQIYILKKLLNDSVIKKSDLESSLCLLSVAGNDYAAYLLNGGKIEDLPGFIQSVVNQLVEDMKTLHELGARKILVPYMPPQGCSPRFAESSTQCNLTVNALVAVHDYFLDKAVKDLNRKSGDSSYYVLDFFNIFLKAYSSEARPLFDEFAGERDLVSWNTLMRSQYYVISALFRHLCNKFLNCWRVSKGVGERGVVAVEGKVHLMIPSAEFPTFSFVWSVPLPDILLQTYGRTKSYGKIIRLEAAAMVFGKGASVAIVVVDALKTTQPLEIPLPSLTIDAPNFTATANQHHAVAPTVPLSVALHLIADDVAIHFWER